MIAFLEGVIAGKTLASVYLNVGGVGFEVGMSQAGLSKLPQVGEQVLVARPNVFGPEPDEIKEEVYNSLHYRLMAHTAEDIIGMYLSDADNERCGHADLRHGFAITFPDLQVLLMMIIPIKVKVLGIIYAIMLVYYVLTAGNMGLMGIPTQVAIVSTLLNAIIFFIVTRRSFRTPNQIKRQRAYKKQVTPMRHVTKHRCAICGRTEVDSPDLEFRFCSKCNGNYEYCQDHLFTHEHKK